MPTINYTVEVLVRDHLYIYIYRIWKKCSYYCIASEELKNKGKVVFVNFKGGRCGSWSLTRVVARRALTVISSPLPRVHTLEER